MTRGRRLEPLELNSEALDELKSFAGSRSLPHGLVRRAKIVLLSHEGLNNTAVAKQLSITRATVGTWRERYRQQGLIACMMNSVPVNHAPSPTRRLPSFFGERWRQSL